MQGSIHTYKLWIHKIIIFLSDFLLFYEWFYYAFVMNA